jgi:aminoglycoside phosphotransferase (APT) family kinase protein
VAATPLDDLQRSLAAELAGALGDAGRGLELRFRSRASDVADGTSVFTLSDGARSPRAVVLCSSPAAPDMVLRGTTRAAAAAHALGATLGRKVLVPLAEGRVHGLTYAVMPFCDGLSEAGPRWVVQRVLLRDPVLDWLASATERTAEDVGPGAVEEAFAAPLRHLASLAAVGGVIRAAAGDAAARIASGAWVPRRVLMHGDLWKGNILIRPRGDAGPGPWRQRFAVIDWPGSEVRGYAMFDLVRLALSLQVGPRRLGIEVARHCRALRCDRADAASHLLAALAHLALTLEHFPMDRFVRTAEVCYAALARASA